LGLKNKASVKKGKGFTFTLSLSEEGGRPIVTFHGETLAIMKMMEEKIVGHSDLGKKKRRCRK